MVTEAEIRQRIMQERAKPSVVEEQIKVMRQKTSAEREAERQASIRRTREIQKLQAARLAQKVKERVVQEPVAPTIAPPAPSAPPPSWKVIQEIQQPIQVRAPVAPPRVAPSWKKIAAVKADVMAPRRVAERPPITAPPPAWKVVERRRAAVVRARALPPTPTPPKWKRITGRKIPQSQWLIEYKQEDVDVLINELNTTSNELDAEIGRVGIPGLTTDRPESLVGAEERIKNLSDKYGEIFAAPELRWAELSSDIKASFRTKLKEMSPQLTDAQVEEFLRLDRHTSLRRVRGALYKEYTDAFMEYNTEFGKHYRVSPESYQQRLAVAEETGALDRIAEIQAKLADLQKQYAVSARWLEPEEGEVDASGNLTPEYMRRVLVRFESAGGKYGEGELGEKMTYYRDEILPQYGPSEQIAQVSMKSPFARWPMFGVPRYPSGEEAERLLAAGVPPGEWKVGGGLFDFTREEAGLMVATTVGLVEESWYGVRDIIGGVTGAGWEPIRARAITPFTIGTHRLTKELPESTKMLAAIGGTLMAIPLFYYSGAGVGAGIGAVAKTTFSALRVPVQLAGVGARFPAQLIRGAGAGLRATLRAQQMGRVGRDVYGVVRGSAMVGKQIGRIGLRAGKEFGVAGRGVYGMVPAKAWPWVISGGVESVFAAQRLAEGMPIEEVISRAAMEEIFFYGVFKGFKPGYRAGLPGQRRVATAWKGLQESAMEDWAKIQTFGVRPERRLRTFKQFERFAEAYPEEAWREAFARKVGIKRIRITPEYELAEQFAAGFGEPKSWAAEVLGKTKMFQWEVPTVELSALKATKIKVKLAKKASKWGRTVDEVMNMQDVEEYLTFTGKKKVSRPVYDRAIAILKAQEDPVLVYKSRVKPPTVPLRIYEDIMPAYISPIAREGEAGWIPLSQLAPEEAVSPLKVVQDVSEGIARKPVEIRLPKRKPTDVYEGLSKTQVKRIKTSYTTEAGRVTAARGRRVREVVGKVYLSFDEADRAGKLIDEGLTIAEAKKAFAEGVVRPPVMAPPVSVKDIMPTGVEPFSAKALASSTNDYLSELRLGTRRGVQEKIFGEYISFTAVEKEAVERAARGRRWTEELFRAQVPTRPVTKFRRPAPEVLALITGEKFADYPAEMFKRLQVGAAVGARRAVPEELEWVSRAVIGERAPISFLRAEIPEAIVRKEGRLAKMIGELDDARAMIKRKQGYIESGIYKGERLRQIKADVARLSRKVPRLESRINRLAIGLPAEGAVQVTLTGEMRQVARAELQRFRARLGMQQVLEETTETVKTGLGEASRGVPFVTDRTTEVRRLIAGKPMPAITAEYGTAAFTRQVKGARPLIEYPPLPISELRITPVKMVTKAGKQTEDWFRFFKGVDEAARRRAMSRMYMKGLRGVSEETAERILSGKYLRAVDKVDSLKKAIRNRQLDIRLMDLTPEQVAAKRAGIARMENRLVGWTEKAKVTAYGERIPLERYRAIPGKVDVAEYVGERIGQLRKRVAFGERVVREKSFAAGVPLTREALDTWKKGVPRWKTELRRLEGVLGTPEMQRYAPEVRAEAMRIARERVGPGIIPQRGLREIIRGPRAAKTITEEWRRFVEETFELKASPLAPLRLETVQRRISRAVTAGKTPTLHFTPFISVAQPQLGDVITESIMGTRGALLPAVGVAGLRAARLRERARVEEALRLREKARVRGVIQLRERGVIRPVSVLAPLSGMGTMMRSQARIAAKTATAVSQATQQIVPLVGLGMAPPPVEVPTKLPPLLPITEEPIRRPLTKEERERLLEIQRRQREFNVQTFVKDLVGGIAGA